MTTPETPGGTRSESETRCPMCERVIREDDLYEEGCPFCGTYIEEADCGCAYELVEDGSVQRKRWFHDPDCTLGATS